MIKAIVLAAIAATSVTAASAEGLYAGVDTAAEANTWSMDTVELFCDGIQSDQDALLVHFDVNSSAVVVTNRGGHANAFTIVQNTPDLLKAELVYGASNETLSIDRFSGEFSVVKNTSVDGFYGGVKTEVTTGLCDVSKRLF